MTKIRFTVNIAARHPSWRSERIATGLEWEPHNAWSVGDRRTTPAGTELPGVRLDSMCSFRFQHEDDQVTPAFLEAVAHLMSHRKFVDELIDSGGELAINIRFNGQFNCNVDMPPETLQSIGAMRARLSVECFPDG